LSELAPATLERMRHDVIEPPSISVLKEEVLAMIAARGHMVQCAGRVKSGKSGHPCLGMSERVEKWCEVE